MRHFRITIISIMVCMGIGFRMSIRFRRGPYLTEAKLRPHLGAYVEQMYQGIGRTTVITVEAEVTETRTASESIPLRITKVLEGAREEGEIVWFCDEHSEEAVTLEAGKTYIMQLREQGVVHEDSYGTERIGSV